MIREYGAAVLVAVAVALLIRLFVVEAYRIPSSTMRPTLEAGDTIFVDKWTFGIRLPGNGKELIPGRDPRRGEVVVFSSPDSPDHDYVKRVLAVEGDRVQIKRGELIVNGRNATLPKPTKDSLCGKERLDDTEYPVCWEQPVVDDFGPVKVPKKHVFVLGDYRSKESGPPKKGSWGMVPVQFIKAKPRWIWMSVEPPRFGGYTSWFSRIRFERMFEPIE